MLPLCWIDCLTNYCINCLRSEFAFFLSCIISSWLPAWFASSQIRNLFLGLTQKSVLWYDSDCLKTHKRGDLKNQKCEEINCAVFMLLTNLSGFAAKSFVLQNWADFIRSVGGLADLWDDSSGDDWQQLSWTSKEPKIIDWKENMKKSLQICSHRSASSLIFYQTWLITYSIKINRSFVFVAIKIKTSLWIMLVLSRL